MQTLQIEIPDGMMEALAETPESLGASLRLLAAVKLYEMGRLSSGKAAELAGIPRVVFLKRLGEFGVSVFSQSSDEVEQDFRNA